jgi:hypothetical protein
VKVTTYTVLRTIRGTLHYFNASRTARSITQILQKQWRSTAPTLKNTGHFIMFCMITNIYNKKTKGPTLMELFPATGKLKTFFLTTRDVRCVRHGWHGTHWYDIQVLATRVNMGASIFFTTAVIRAFRSARSRGNGGTYTVQSDNKLPTSKKLIPNHLNPIKY